MKLVEHAKQQVECRLAQARTDHIAKQQQQRQQQEHTGQLTLSDIRFPLTGTQLSLSEWVTPYEIVNPSPSPKRIKSPKAPKTST